MNLFEKLPVLVQQVKSGRSETRLALAGGSLLGARLWLLNDEQSQKMVEFVAPVPWVSGVLLLVGALLLFLYVVRLWRSVGATEGPPQTTGFVLRGASAFREIDGEIFKQLGRLDELNQLRSWIEDPAIRLVILMGDSGVGKTSLLRAGVTNLGGSKAAYWEAGQASKAAEQFRAVVANTFGKHPNEVDQGVLILDQAEQLGEDREVFEMLKAHLEAQPAPGSTWILAMRQEFLGTWVTWAHEAGVAPLAQQLSETLALSAFTLEQAKKIFGTLAREAEMTVREEVRDQILRAIAPGGSISPVDLNIALQVLKNNPRYAEDPRHFLSVGGSSAMLTSYLEGELEKCPDAGTRDAVCRALLELIDLEQDRRKAEGASVEELQKVAQPPVVTLFVSALERLALPGVRVLEKVEDGRVRLVHERFIPAVRRLAGAVLSETERAQRLLDRRCAVWLREGEARRFLLRGKELRQVERELPRLRWGEGREGKERYLQVSRGERRVVRMARATAAVLALISLGFLVHWRQVENVKTKMNSWGLPVGLYEVLPRVESLDLRDIRVSELGWLARASRLTKLELQGSKLDNLGAIPASVSQLTLDLGGSQVRSLAGLPERVQDLTLDLGGSQVRSLAGLPKSVQNLALDLGDSQVRSLAGLPKSVRNLALDLGDSQVRSLEWLPESVQDLTLNLGRLPVHSVAWLPESVQSLTLYLGGSQVRSLEWLPESLQDLTLDLGGSQVRSLAGLPKGLQNLTLDLGDSQVRSLAGLPESVQNLTLDLDDSLVFSLAGIPESVQDLTLDLGRLPVHSVAGLPESVQSLTLDLSDSWARSLAGIPESVQSLTLDLGDSQVHSLEWLPESVQDLTLDLGGSEVRSLEGLPGGLSLVTLGLSNSKITNLDHLPPNATLHLTL